MDGIRGRDRITITALVIALFAMAGCASTGRNTNPRIRLYASDLAVEEFVSCDGNKNIRDDLVINYGGDFLACISGRDVYDSVEIDEQGEAINDLGELPDNEPIASVPISRIKPVYAMGSISTTGGNPEIIPLSPEQKYTGRVVRVEPGVQCTWSTMDIGERNDDRVISCGEETHYSLWPFPFAVGTPEGFLEERVREMITTSR